MNAVPACRLALRTADGRVHPGWFLGCLLVLLLAVNLTSLGSGAMPADWRDLFESGNRAHAVLWQLRLPRMILAMLAGAGLAIGGAALQALFRNPLADPGVLGISSGAALGAGLMIVVIPTTAAPVLAPFAVPFAAFVGALAATAAVLMLAGPQARWLPAATLLAGIAVNALTGAGLGLLSYLADDAALRNLTFWTLGSLAGATWPVLAPVAALAVLALAGLLRRGPALNVLLLGEAQARHAGVDVHRLKATVIGSTALAVGALVAVTGIIGFVGLVAPHLVRLCIGADHRWLLPGAGLAGALLLSCADLSARTLVAPAELPVGLLTALIGGPFFLGLLRRERGAP